jgi:hypothetical protein
MVPMPVTGFFIWWDEFDRRDMPCVCMQCGVKKAKWRPYSFAKLSNETKHTSKVGGSSARVTREVEAPFCEKHIKKGPLDLSVTVSDLDFNDDGVWIRDAHEDFVFALKLHREAEVKTWKEEMEDAEDIDDTDEAKRPPGLRTAPEAPKYDFATLLQDKNFKWVFIGLGVFGVVLVLSILAVPCVFCVGVAGFRALAG